METTTVHDEKRLVHVMNLLGDSTRFEIFKLLKTDNEYCVGEIADKLNISSSAVSQHFRNFEMIGLVDKHRYGQKICYALKSDDLLVKDLKELTKEN